MQSESALGSRPRILLTGATGYIGGRLLLALLERGVNVRCLARRPEAIPPHPGLEVVAGDALDRVAVRRALEGIDVAYYLIHAMGAPESFERLDRKAAVIFADRARDAASAKATGSRRISPAARRSGACSPRPASRPWSSAPRS